MEPRLKAIWPRDTRFERRCFELLREANRICAEELDWPGSRVTALRDMVEQLCRERSADLSEAA